MNASNSTNEKIQIFANELLATVKKLVKDGSVRKIVIRDETGKERVSIPMNLGAGVGILALVTNPVLTLLAGATATVGAKMTRYTIEVERTDIVTSDPIDTEAGAPPSDPDSSEKN